MFEIFWTLICGIGFLWGLNLVYYFFCIIGHAIDFLADRIYDYEHTS